MAGSFNRSDLPDPKKQKAYPETSDFDTSSAAEGNVPPPPYGGLYGEINNELDGLSTSARVTDDGRVNIHINQLNRRLSQIYIPALREHAQKGQEIHPPQPLHVPISLGGTDGAPLPPPLSIVIQVVGSRGDVQPFVALGKVLKERYRHRVRIATHPVFQNFIQEHGLEFFSIGGDPAQLMAFMVRNPGLMPGFRSIFSGDISQRRKDVAEYIQGCWRSCYEAGDGISPVATTTNHSGSAAQAFVADCIIANPPSFAHIHCAERLGIPLHIMFTMPYSPTQAFPHPLANIQYSNADPQVTNYMSYAMIEVLSWQGLGEIINRFREKCLGLDPVSLIWAPGMLQRLEVPHTYCWSPALIPKPSDWGSRLSISGFFQLDLVSDYVPPSDLRAFLDTGSPPVYIGFGSIVLDDPHAMMNLILSAVKQTGQRFLLSKGWSGMDTDQFHIPNNVFLLGDVPHDWLFKHVSCVIHHGGAGTTAAGITAGRPTLVIPFFGDQPFWGAMVARAGAGPDPIPHKQLTVENLSDAINFCLKPKSLERAEELARKIAAEQGNEMGAHFFHQHLDADQLRCHLDPARPAAWTFKNTRIRLSSFAACTLANAKLLDFHDLKLFRPREYHPEEGPWDPISGGFTSLFGAFSSMVMGLADFPSETFKAMSIPFGTKRPKMKSSTPSDVGKNRSLYLNESSASIPSPTKSKTSFNSEQSLTPPQSILNMSQLSLSTSKTGTGFPSEQEPGVQTLQQDQSTRVQDHDKPVQRRHYDMLRQTGIHTSKGFGRIVRTAVEAPMEISVSLTQGFHNVPKLWGDDTVRDQEKITDLKSGMKASGKEFGFGMYDGITGLVTQPLRGAQKEGTIGFFKGVGKGIGGFATKPGAALWALPAYFMKGVHKEVKKLFHTNVQNYIVVSRVAQGYEDWLQSSDLQKQDVMARWKRIQESLKRKTNLDNIEGGVSRA